MQNGVSSDVYEGERQEKNGEIDGRKKEEKGRKEKKREMKGKKKKESLDPGGSGLSHFEGDFQKF